MDVKTHPTRIVSYKSHYFTSSSSIFDYYYRYYYWAKGLAGQNGPVQTADWKIRRFSSNQTRKSEGKGLKYGRPHQRLVLQFSCRKGHRNGE
jgi:hypothetical protein